MGELLCHLIKLLFLIKVNGVLIIVSLMMNMYAYLSQIMN